MIVAPTLENFFTGFLKGLGLPVTQQNLNALYGVAQLEGWNNRYNPLNVVQPMPGSHPINSAGVQAFDSFDDGVRASVELFSGSHWAGVRQALAQGNSAQAVLQAFKQAYTWDPGVQFPMGSPNEGSRVVGPNGGSGSAASFMDTAAGSGGAAGGAGANPTQQQYEGVDSLGALLQAVPDLRKILNQAEAQGWSLQKFQNEVENSDWYKNHAETAREALIQKYNDPASWDQRLKQTEGTVNQLASSLGFTLTADQAAAIANNALLTGNDTNSQFLTDAIGKRQDFSNIRNVDQLAGTEANTADQIAQIYASYGFRVPANLIAHQAKLVVEGYQTTDTYKNNAIQWASGAFPALAKQLSDGQTTVADLASPYISSMSQLLELDPSQLSVYTPMIRQALQGGTNKQGDRATTPLWQFEQQVRNDPRWQFTQNARDTASQVLHTIGQDWGFSA